MKKQASVQERTAQVSRRAAIQTIGAVAGAAAFATDALAQPAQPAPAPNAARVNAPNDVAAHVDGSYWFTDPPAGSSLYEGMPDAPGGLRNPNGILNGKVGQPAGSGVLKGELGSNIYRADPSGRVDMMISEEAFGGGGNGIAFSPDYKKVYIVSRGIVFSFDLSPDGKTMRNQKQFADFMLEGIRCGTDC